MKIYLNTDIDLTFDFELSHKDEHHRVWSSINHNDYTIEITEMPFGVFESARVSDNLINYIEYIKNEFNESIKESIAHLQKGFDDSEDEDNETVLKPYNPKDIKIRNANWSIGNIFDLIYKYKKVDLSPDFQRDFVWNTKQQSLLIESLILGIPIPAFYLAEDSKGRFYVVDGVQRLTTITRFLSNEFPLKNLEYLGKDNFQGTNLNGCYAYKKDNNDNKKYIDEEVYLRILQTQINVNIIEDSSPIAVRYDVFRRINTGGKPLNNQEIRNCLAEPHTRRLINELVALPSFKAATLETVSTTRMEAHELVLRFIGFYYIKILGEKSIEYRGNMTKFLNEMIEFLNKTNGKNFNKIKQDFDAAMQLAEHLFGQYAFRKCLTKDLQPNVSRQLLNKSLFTTWSVELSKYNTTNIIAQNKKNAFAYLIADILEQDKNYMQAVSYKTNESAILNFAFEKTASIIKNHLITA